jgi:pectin methylesterase-like acyl-CoA thioesterase
MARQIRAVLWGGRACSAAMLLLAAGMLFTGCVTYEEERLASGRQTTLTVARAGDTVAIQFPTDKGYSYTVLYTASLNSGAWQPLPNGSNIQGTGDIVSLEDHVPNGSQRYYRLQIHTGAAKRSKR